MAGILVVYSTTDGHTRKICDRLREVIEREGSRVTLVDVERVADLDPAAFDKIVIGASIRYGRHAAQVFDFIRRNRKILDARPNAFFSVNVVARKPEKNLPETNPYMRKFLRSVAWRPRQLAVFAGRLDYPSYRPTDRMIIRLIMWLTGGPTDPSTVVEFTDWRQVEAFGSLVARM